MPATTRRDSDPIGRPRRTFRDPSGTLLFVEGRPLRLIRPAASGIWDFLASDTAQRWRDRRTLVDTERVSPEGIEELLHRAEFRTIYESESWASVARHDSVPFVSYPHEWTPGMLHAAATLTLDLADDLLRDGRGLKDATPYNVVFRGPDAVFVDVLSVEDRDPGDPVWVPYAQFVRTFLLPLLLQREIGRPLRALLGTNVDGIGPEEAFRALSLGSLVSRPALSLVTLPVLTARMAGRRFAADPQRRSIDPERARFVLRGLLRHLRRALVALTPSRRPSSGWTAYAEREHPPEYLAAKRELVADVVREFRPALMLDVGCNTGELSFVAARHGTPVVAIDADAESVERVWSVARDEHLDISPLVVDVANPTPAMGWRNTEWGSFLERASRRADLVVAMAILHHLLVTAGASLPTAIDFFASLARDLVLIEFVPPHDPHFRRLSRGRDALYAGVTQHAFETQIARHFSIVRRVALPVDGRVAYLLRRC